MCKNEIVYEDEIELDSNILTWFYLFPFSRVNLDLNIFSASNLFVQVSRESQYILVLFSSKEIGLKNNWKIVFCFKYLYAIIQDTEP
jgi:hypothetical protein